MVDQKKVPSNASWQPPDEMVASVVARMKQGHPDQWGRLKETEAQNAGVDNSTVARLLSIEAELYPCLDIVQVANLLLRVRGAARQESGLKS